MAALFACTRCHSRHPFDELSGAEQLCKDCRSNFPVVKCTYCRAEFQQDDKGTSSFCKKCIYNVKQYGKPTACEYCNIIAAFIGNKCQRCTNSEKKWGPPQSCEQCKQQCAFKRQEDTKTKGDGGKLLCWLCTQSYKRVLAKAKMNSMGNLSSLQNTPMSTGSDSQKPSNNNKTKPSSTENSTELPAKNMESDKEKPEQHHKHDKHHKSHHHHKDSSDKHHHKHHHHHNHKHKDKSKERDDEKKDKHHKHKHHEHKEKKEHSHHKHDKHDKHSHHSGKHKAEEEEGKSNQTSDSATAPPANKKARLEKTTSNGFTLSTALSTDNSFSDLMSTDNMIAITQLKEEVESLKKQLQVKDSQLLEKDKKLTILKAEKYEEEKNNRQKLTALQKDHKETLESLQAKNRQLQKELTALQKAKPTKKASSSPVP